MNDTRERLLEATLRVVAESGLAKASARTIANQAGVNQALVFYHFSSVDELLDAASKRAVAALVERTSIDLAAATSFADLFAIGAALRVTTDGHDSASVLAEFLAGARHNEALRATTEHALTTWITQIEGTVERLLTGNPVAEVLDADAIAHTVSAGFIGVMLYDGIDPAGADRALGGLREVVTLVDGLGDLGPTRKRAALELLKRVRPERNG